MGTGTGASEERNNLNAGPPQSDHGGGGGPQVGSFQGMASDYHETRSRPHTSAPPSSSSVLKTVLRVVSLLLALVCAAIIASAEYQIYLGNVVKALQVRAFRFLVATAAIVMTYELAQIVLSCIERAQSPPFTATYIGALIVFVFDHVFGYLMFAAATSGATYADIFRHDGGGDRCQFVGNLCQQVEAGVAMGFLAFGALAALALLSGFNFCKQHTNSVR